MAVVVNRYVEALFDLAKSEEEKNTFELGLKEMANLFATQEEFKKMLLDPRIANEVKLEVVKEVLPEYSQEVFINFLQILIQEKRIGYIQEIATEFEAKNRIRKNELVVKIIVAKPIGEEQVKQIVEKYKKMYKVEKIQYTVEVDESILGGVKVVVGNTVYDGSVETQLKQMF